MEKPTHLTREFRGSDEYRKYVKIISELLLKRQYIFTQSKNKIPEVRSFKT